MMVPSQLLQTLGKQGLVIAGASSAALLPASSVLCSRLVGVSQSWRAVQTQPTGQEQQSGASTQGTNSAAPSASSQGTNNESAANTTAAAGASIPIPNIDAEQLKEQLYTTFKAGIGGVKSTIEAAAQAAQQAAGAASSTSSSSSSEDVNSSQNSSSQSEAGSSSSSSTGSTGSTHHSRPGLLSLLAKDVRDVFSPADNIRSATRKYTGPLMDLSADPTGSTALMLVQQQETAWDRVKDKLSSLPFLSSLASLRVKDSAAFKKGQDLVEDLKEKYETSDHPMVHKVDEVKERLMSGSESSRAMREVRTRDPAFDINNFVRAIKLDAPVVVKAFLRHDMDTLALHMGPELLERLAGIYKHEKEKGLWEDPTILFVSDVEVVETRMMEGDPFLVAQFHCQQLKCTRDAYGNVVEGASDTIQRVYYFWGLQQEKQGVITADGQLLPPRWVIKDMMWQSMLALV